MKLRRKIFLILIFAGVGAVMILSTVRLISDPSKVNLLTWIQRMASAAWIVLYGIYVNFANGEWAEKHPRGARIADGCGWAAIVFGAIGLIMYLPIRGLH